MSHSKRTLVVAVGDVCVDRAEPDSIFDLIRGEIKEADLAFCQIETTYSERGSPNPLARIPFRASPANVAAIARAGFNVASFASNHCMDWGEQAFADTLANLNASGVKTFGAGGNIAAARKPLVIEHNGNRLGWLAYCSILHSKFWADSKRPGAAPARAHTLYEPLEAFQPGTPARTLSFPYDEDLENMCEDIRLLREDVDIVLVSMHWGIHFKEGEIARYQVSYAHRAIDAGADVIIGHHAHILKPAEIYREKPIFYSLCNFAFDQRYSPEAWNDPERAERRLHLNPTWTLDPEFQTYPFPKDSRKSILVKIACEDRRIMRVSCVPLMINQYSQPRRVSNAQPEFEEILEYMRRITKDQKLHTQYVVSGDEFVLQ